MPGTVKQGVYSRSPRFDGTPQQILTVQDVATQVKPPGLWLNIQVCIWLQYAFGTYLLPTFSFSISKNLRGTV